MAPFIYFFSFLHLFCTIMQTSECQGINHEAKRVEQINETKKNKTKQFVNRPAGWWMVSITNMVMAELSCVAMLYLSIVNIFPQIKAEQFCNIYVRTINLWVMILLHCFQLQLKIVTAITHIKWINVATSLLAMHNVPIYRTNYLIELINWIKFVLKIIILNDFRIDVYSHFLV